MKINEKLILFLIIIFVFKINIFSNEIFENKLEKIISVDIKEKNLGQILKKILKPLSLRYSTETDKGNPEKISLKYENISLKELLNEIKFKYEEKNIYYIWIFDKTTGFVNFIEKKLYNDKNYYLNKTIKKFSKNNRMREQLITELFRAEKNTDKKYKGINLVGETHPNERIDYIITSVYATILPTDDGYINFTVKNETVRNIFNKIIFSIDKHYYTWWLIRGNNYSFFAYKDRKGK